MIEFAHVFYWYYLQNNKLSRVEYNKEESPKDDTNWCNNIVNEKTVNLTGIWENIKKDMINTALIITEYWLKKNFPRVSLIW